MMARSAAFLTLACLLIAVPRTASVINCQQVYTYVLPCLPYARSGGVMPAGCCSGVRALNSAAATTPDRQAACRCLETLARSTNPSIAAGIPGKCGVNVPYSLSPNTDCSKIS